MIPSPLSSVRLHLPKSLSTVHLFSLCFEVMIVIWFWNNEGKSVEDRIHPLFVIKSRRKLCARSSYTMISRTDTLRFLYQPKVKSNRKKKNPNYSSSSLLSIWKNKHNYRRIRSLQGPYASAKCLRISHGFLPVELS